jgi:hypothetical protein
MSAAADSFNNPAAWQHHKAGRIVAAFDNLQTETIARAHCTNPVDEFTGIAPVSPDHPQSSESMTQVLQHEFGTIAILCACYMHNDQQQSQPIDQQMALTS